MNAFIDLFPKWKSPNYQPPQPNFDALIASNIANCAHFLFEPVDVIGVTAFPNNAK